MKIRLSGEKGEKGKKIGRNAPPGERGRLIAKNWKKKVAATDSSICGSRVPDGRRNRWQNTKRGA